jgi:hypothetical protein
MLEVVGHESYEEFPALVGGEGFDRRGDSAIAHGADLQHIAARGNVAEAKSAVGACGCRETGADQQHLDFAEGFATLGVGHFPSEISGLSEWNRKQNEEQHQVTVRCDCSHSRDGRSFSDVAVVQDTQMHDSAKRKILITAPSR